MSHSLSRVSRAARKRSDSIEELRQAIRLARSSGVRVEEIAAAAGVTRIRIYQILKEEK